MPGALVTTENLAGFTQLSADLGSKLTAFPFELPVSTIVDDYAARYPAASS
jgi:hypothetical protein